MSLPQVHQVAQFEMDPDLDVELAPALDPKIEHAVHAELDAIGLGDGESVSSDDQLEAYMDASFSPVTGSEATNQSFELATEEYGETPIEASNEESKKAYGEEASDGAAGGGTFSLTSSFVANTTCMLALTIAMTVLGGGA